MKTELTSLGHVQEAIQGNEGILLYIYNDHCAPCLSLRPKVKNMVESKFPELKLVLVNSEFYPDIPAHFGIFSNPAILLFIQGKEYHRASKYVSESQLSETIGRLYEMAFN